jgi:arylsulfatase A-like enzyme
VTLDTFRADHLGCGGSADVRTPHLDRLARRSLHWFDAVTGIPLTTPSHATILTGRSPRSHGLLKNRMRLPEGVTSVAEILKASGYRTGAVVSSRIVLGPEFGLDRGFDEYEVVEPDRYPGSGEGARTTEAAVDWLAERGGTGSFLWVHYFDPHLPYLPPDPFDRLHDGDYDGPYHRTAEPVQQIFHDAEADVDLRDIRHQAALYAAEVSFVDRCVGGLVRAREQARGVPESAREDVLLVTADHGEGLFEHNRYLGHDLLLYETSLRVPLLLAGATGRRPGLVKEGARTRDVAPTLLGLTGIDVPPEMEGRDLLRDSPPAGEDALFVAESHPSREKASSLYAIRTEEHKLVWYPRQRRKEGYDLVRDPGERNDLYGTEPFWDVLFGDLGLDLKRRPVGRPRTVDEETGGADAATREALRSLGYVD